MLFLRKILLVFGIVEASQLGKFSHILLSHSCFMFLLLPTMHFLSLYKFCIATVVIATTMEVHCFPLLLYLLLLLRFLQRFIAYSKGGCYYLLSFAIYHATTLHNITHYYPPPFDHALKPNLPWQAA